MFGADNILYMLTSVFIWVTVVHIFQFITFSNREEKVLKLTKFHAPRISEGDLIKALYFIAIQTKDGGGGGCVGGGSVVGVSWWGGMLMVVLLVVGGEVGGGFIYYIIKFTKNFC